MSHFDEQPDGDPHGECAAEIARLTEALREIALAGMSGTGQESEDGMRAWHARRAWEFIGIAARALSPIPPKREDE